MPGTILMCRLLHGCAGDMRLAPVESLVATPVFHRHRLGERQSQRRGGRSSGHALGRTRRPARRPHLRAAARRAPRGPSKAKERSLPVTVRRSDLAGWAPYRRLAAHAHAPGAVPPGAALSADNAGLTYDSDLDPVRCGTGHTRLPPCDLPVIPEKRTERLKAGNQHGVSPTYRNRVRKLSPRNRNQCVQHLPGSHTAAEDQAQSTHKTVRPRCEHGAWRSVNISWSR